jgi:cell division protein FtsN
MSGHPEAQDDDAEREAARQADAMKHQLRKDVDSWAKARSEASPGHVPVAAKPVSSPVARARKPRPPAAPAPSQADTRSKPYRMSYDGGTTAEYIQYMIDRGAR